MWECSKQHFNHFALILSLGALEDGLINKASKTLWLASAVIEQLRVSKMKQILLCDWLPERARWSYFAPPPPPPRDYPLPVYSVTKVRSGNILFLGEPKEKKRDKKSSRMVQCKCCVCYWMCRWTSELILYFRFAVIFIHLTQSGIKTALKFKKDHLSK